MSDLYFVTTNSQKFAKGLEVCQQYDVHLQQQSFDIDEVQSEDTEYVARQKAAAAFAVAGKPVVISDDAWTIHGLRGFPGTYAKSVNNWFTAEDFIRLTRDLANRQASFIQTLVYQDEHTQQVFQRETVGTLLREARGDSGVSIQAVVSLEDDKTTSIAEMIGDGTHYKGTAALQVWHDFAAWYSQQM